MKYCFILGIHPALSRAELNAVLPGVLCSDDIPGVRILESASDEIVDILPSLGGTVKIGKVVGKVERKHLDSFLDLNRLFTEFLVQSEKKINFGISLYGDASSNLAQKVQQIGLAIKKELTRHEYRARFVTGTSPELSSVIVRKNQLIERGAEILLLVRGNIITVAKTIAIQPFEEYSFRDYGRPVRDSRAGMLPPKLAQIMVNLSRAPKTGVLLDPFCGSGTIIQEAILMGYQQVIGSDRSMKAVEDTKQNIEWLFKNFPIEGTKPKIEIFQADIQTLASRIQRDSVDAIVTEPYLGPVFVKKPDMKLLSRIQKELSELYLQSFHAFRSVLKKPGVVVIIFPYWQTTRGEVRLNIHDHIERLGFQRMVVDEPLTYSRPDQKVLREITIWKI